MDSRHARRLAAALVLTVAPHAFAQERASSELQLVWSAPATCPDEAGVVAEVERLLGRPLARGSGDPLVVAGHVTAGPPWRAQLAIVHEGGQSTRTLEAGDCTRLANAMALILAMVIDPSVPGATGASGSGSPSVSASPSPSPSTSTPAGVGEGGRRQGRRAMPQVWDDEIPRDPVPDRAPATIVPPAFQLGVGVVGGIGILPGYAAAVEARVGLSLGSLRVALRGDYWIPASFEAQSMPVPVGLTTVGVQGCYANRRGAFELRVCAAVDLGEMRASNALTMGPSGAMWGATFGEFAVAWQPVRYVSLRVEAGPGVTLATPSFYYMSVGTVAYQPSPVVGRAALIAEFWL